VTDHVPPSISVIVPTYDAPVLLPAVLASLGTQLYPRERAEIIVIDDGSPDRSEAALQQYQGSLPLKPILLEAREGRARARNAGIRAAEGNLVVFLDDDMTVNADFLSAHAQFHRDHPGEVAIGDIRFGPQIVPAAITRYIESRGAQRFADGAPLPFKCFVTGNSSVERARLLNVGLFDERFEVYGGEDLELGYRLHGAGARFRLCAAAGSLHHRVRPLGQTSELMYTYGRHSLPLLLEKHPELCELLRLDFLQAGWFSPRRWMLRLALQRFIYAPIALWADWRQAGTLPSILIDYLWWYNRTRGFLHYRSSVDA
jgi:glycosyltransferase involved in cell wall biosynthesis